MTLDDSTFAITETALQARDSMRREDMVVALRQGVHFWIAGATFRVSGPSDDLLLDAETICGWTPVHCGLCGVDNNDDPKCYAGE
jgi:hypothetical protein